MVFLTFFLGNEYRKTAFKVPMENFCDWVQNDKYIYSRLVKFSNLPPRDNCPFMLKVIV
jgi:hypothetical protein